MTTQWVVVVTTGASAYIYGPFTSKGDAHDWIADNANTLYGNERYVIPHKVIEPS